MSFARLRSVDHTCRAVWVSASELEPICCEIDALILHGD